VVSKGGAAGGVRLCRGWAAEFLLTLRGCPGDVGSVSCCGGPGIAPSSSNESSSLLQSGAGTTLDTSGGATNGDYYVTTSVATGTGSCPLGGCFSITGDYGCTAGTQVYLYSLGGSQGGVTNPVAGLLAALGNCPSGGSFATETPFVVVNEVSTIAAAYAFAGFASDALHVSSSGTVPLAQTGIANAFANAANLAGISTGAALATTPAGNGTVPQTTINTLANILAACVNSNGASSGPTSPTACYTLFHDAQSGGSSGTLPGDTATAAINMAHNPGTNIMALYALSTASPPFAPALSAKPNDFTIALNFTGGGLSSPIGIAIDGSGNAWVANDGNSSVTELTSLGASFANSPYTGGGLYYPDAIAIDGPGHVWVANDESAAGVNGGNGSVTELSSSGTPTSGSPYTGGGLNGPAGLAIDGSGNAWVSDSGTDAVSEFNSGGTAQSGPGGYMGGGLSVPYGIAIDGSGDGWVANNSGGTLSKFNSAGTAISTSSGYTGGGLNAPKDLAIDSAGNVWVANNGNSTISKFNNTGTAISTSSGYSGGGLNAPIVIGIDGAGNVWAANQSTSSVSEFNSTGTAITGSSGYTCGGCMNLPAGPSLTVPAMSGSRTTTIRFPN